MITIDCECCGNGIEIAHGVEFQQHGIACPVCNERYYVTTRPASRAIAMGNASKLTIHGDVAGRDLVRGKGK